MTLRDSYQAKLKLRAGKHKARDSAVALAEEVYEYIGKNKISWGRMMTIIQHNGERCVRELLSEMKAKERDARAIPLRNRAAYFLKLCTIYKTQLTKSP